MRLNPLRLTPITIQAAVRRAKRGEITARYLESRRRCSGPLAHLWMWIFHNVLPDPSLAIVDLCAPPPVPNH
jgi:hypothetical protein